MSRNHFIGLAGNIGVGKTTFTSKMCRAMGWKAYYESVADNPYLDNFYGDMNRWSFNLQIYFLHHRFKAHQEMGNSNGGVVQDRTIYEDVEIFARNLFVMGKMDQRDWDNYRNLFSIMIPHLKKPDLIIYLRAKTDTLQTRIKSRARDFEKSIDPEYLHQINVAYDSWINNIKNIPVLTVETDNFNIHRDSGQFQKILSDVQGKLEKSYG